MVPAAAAPTTQSTRSVADGETPMGVGTTRSLERVAAAISQLEKVELRFEPADEFVCRKIIHPNGETSDLLLAERGTCLSNGLWLR